MKNPVVFLDRDGTLIEEVNYLSRVEDLRLFPFTADAVKLLKDNGFLVIVVTNQSGIGRGIFDEASVHAIHEKIQSEVSGMIDAFYFCPHLPCDGCKCRKPNLGMIESAMADFDIDLNNSWMVGDKKIDVETGRAMNLRTALVLTGYGQQHKTILECLPEIISDNLGDAASRILESILRAETRV
ncbi:MAG: D-glycero-alpha-D-manno-heptose-1,7-bisphosphate 7-phosphatase [Pyrinomonadaceae bacterium]